MNLVALMGRLTKDPEVRYTQGENPTAVAKFTIAVDREIKHENGPTADFISCTAFGKTAEFIEKYFSKGRKIGLSGRIQTGSYQKDGQTIYTTDVLVNKVDFADSKPEGTTTAPTNAAPMDNTGFMNIPDDIAEELPFV